MATLTPQVVNRDGLQIVFGAADVAGDEFANTGNEELLLKNDDAGAKVATIAFQKTVDGQVITCANRTINVPAGEQVIAGLWRPTKDYNDGNGNLQVTYDDVTNLSVAVLQVI